MFRDDSEDKPLKDSSQIVESNAKSERAGLMGSRVHIVPTSDHNMHMDNPQALANILINDVYDSDLPVEENEEHILF